MQTKMQGMRASTGPRPVHSPSPRHVKCAYGPLYTYTDPRLPTLTELDWLATHTTILPESSLTVGGGRTVSYALLRSIATSERLGIKPLQNALTSARTVDPSPDRQVDRALVNVGAVLSEEVDGRISTEVDPRLAHDKDALIAKTRALASLYVDLHVPKSRLLFRIPATWAGICAAKVLEEEGLNVQLAMVYSMIQAVAAGQAGISLINPRVGRTRDWYMKNPGAIRDPKGPRQDAGGVASGPDPGVQLVAQVYDYLKVHHPKTQVMASSIRSREDALALAGCDFLLLTNKVIAALERTPTITSYNDGLRSPGNDEDEMEVPLTADKARAHAPQALPTVTEASFKEGLGLAGAQLLASSLADAVKDVDALGDLNRATTGLTST